MATYTTSDFKPGLKFMQDGEPCVIVENEFVKPGKGQAFTRTRIRKLISGKVLDVNFKSGTSVEAADVMDLNLTYSYKDDAFWYLGLALLKEGKKDEAIKAISQSTHAEKDELLKKLN